MQLQGKPGRHLHHQPGPRRPGEDALLPHARSLPVRVACGARVTRAAGLRHAPAPAARGVRRPEPPAGLGHVTPTRLRGTTLESIQKLGVSAQVTPGSGPPACPRGHLPAGGRAGASCWGESPAPGLPWALSTRVTSRQVAEALLGGRPWLRREARAGLKPCRTVSDGRDAPERVRLHPRGRPPALPPAAALGHGPAAGRVRAAPAPRRRWASRQVPSDEHGSRGPPTRPSVTHTHPGHLPSALLPTSPLLPSAPCGRPDGWQLPPRLCPLKASFGKSLCPHLVCLRSPGCRLPLRQDPSKPPDGGLALPDRAGRRSGSEP